MKLLELKIKNFKGIKDFTFSPQGKNANIYGKTGSGKTTLSDAFRWLMFGKDSKDRANFSVKPISNNGDNQKGINVEVSASLELDNKIIELKKVLKEKWTKKKNNQEKVFTGHTVDYFINDIPKKEREYNEYISSIIDEKLFKILIDPYYFSENLLWQDRRIMLFDLCGNVSDEEIINNNKNLQEINDFLDSKKIDDYRLILKGKRREINKTLAEIPTRIDEAAKAMIFIENICEDDIRKNIEEIEKRLKDNQEKRLLIENDKDILEKKEELRSVKQQISNFVFDYERKIDDEIYAKRKEIQEIDSKYENINVIETAKTKQHKTIDDEIDELESEIIKLRTQWHDENSKEFIYRENNICPTCGQKLPTEKIKDTHDKALETFNKEKSENLEQIQKKGKELKTSIDILTKDRARLKKELSVLRSDKETLNRNAKDIEKQILQIREKKDKYTRDERFLELAKKDISLDVMIKNLSLGDKKNAFDSVCKEIDSLEKALNEARHSLLKLLQNKEQEKRLEELKSQERTLSKEYQEIERQLYLLDLFVREKANIVEDRINSKFNLAQFRLFNQLVNGDLEECCEVTDKKGVPFLLNLSGGERISIGLDIISTLSEHFDIRFPIFIDDAILTTEKIKTPGQQIKLYVAPNQEKLKVLSE